MKSMCIGVRERRWRTRKRNFWIEWIVRRWVFSKGLKEQGSGPCRYLGEMNSGRKNRKTKSSEARVCLASLKNDVDTSVVVVEEEWESIRRWGL